MRRTMLLAALFLLLALSSGRARIWIVYPDGSGQAPTIQAGIDSSAAGDTIVAMPGVYAGAGNWNVDFLGKAIVVMGAASYDSTITDKTIIDFATLDCPDWICRAFYFHSNEDSTSVLSGFEIRNLSWASAAIECDHSSPTIVDNVTAGLFLTVALQCIESSPKIIENTLYVDRGWGSLTCEGGSPYLAHNTIFTWDNTGWFGSLSWSFANCTSLQMRGNNVGAGTINNCTGIIDGNDIHADWYMAGLDISGSTLTITRNKVYGYGRTDAITCAGSSLIIENNRIMGNLIMQESLPSMITANNIVGTDDMPYSGAIVYGGDSSTEIGNNVIESSYDASGIVCNSAAGIFDNLIVSYSGHWDAAGIKCMASAIIEGNTIIRKYGSDGMHFGAASSAIVRNNIIVGLLPYDPEPPSDGGTGIYSESPSIVVACCNVYSNEGGNYMGISDQTGMNGNVSADPIFCDVAHGDYSIHAQSPCAPGNHPGGAECGLIGALGVGCDYVATLVQSYRATVESSGIFVRWELATGAAVGPSFVILRKESGAGEYEELGAQADIVHSGTLYSFRDTRCEPAATYRYRVDVIDENGRQELFETDAVAMPALPLTLYQNHPNPFNPSTTIEYYLPEKARVKLEVYDVSGKRIAVLIDGEQGRGVHAISWNGTDAEGNAAASGIYFSRLTAGKETVSKKMVLLK